MGPGDGGRSDRETDVSPASNCPSALMIEAIRFDQASRQSSRKARFAAAGEAVSTWLSTRREKPTRSEASSAARIAVSMSGEVSDHADSLSPSTTRLYSASRFMSDWDNWAPS